MSLVHLVVALTAVSLLLYATMMSLFARAMWRRRRRGPLRVDRAPRVTIFKPLAGRDDDLEANLESFARIDYPSFELLLGVASMQDPAYDAARRFVGRHPRIEARVVLTDADAAVNPKVAQLLGLERLASGDVYVISDSNVRVAPSYLWSLVGELADERVGMACSVFAGTGERTLGAALENLEICSHATPGLVAMDAVTDRPLTVGKSMAVRRRDLVRLGGFVPVGHLLAEDHALGRRFLDAGLAARTTLDVVENRNTDCSMARTLERHTRWSKMRRALFPVAFAFEPIMTPVVVASAGFAIAPCRATASLFAATCVLQTAAAQIAVRGLRGQWLSWRYLPLEMVRSYVMLLCWARACISRRIAWRGHAFTMRRGTVIVPASAGHRDDARARLAA
ncbi:MAG TPA: glycosyltransferase [Polyangiaceae bacterium]